MSIERQAISGLKWTGAARFVSQTVSWAVTLIVVRLLAPADYGIVAVSAVVISIFSTDAELGLGVALVYLPCLSLLNKKMWTDVQRLFAAFRA
jgi:O-antigen/teichoic acid export membrane protein